MPRRVKLAVAYDGTAYSGWQVQPNGTTIQAVVEGAFSRILQEPVRLRAAGRTDAGVHAREQVVDFADAGVRDLETIVHGGNALLPPDIRVLSASVVPETFDARRHATEKAYRYFLYLSPVASPFLSRYAWHIEAALDLDAIRRGLSHLLGEHDFTSFRGQGCNARSPVRTIFRAEVAKHEVPGLFSIDVAGAGFLRHMVRNIVGTVVNAGKGRHSADHVGEILRARDRSAAGVNAPPHGLFLWRVSY
ncbi:tRNA pseudouridine(38-40) synthase TruA [Candidatus Deferrimicrobium sp.]|uniref:tRNA pseudouridine(38-40) synthase TruA n=1 Tax=Candidatus Deferrimicrobium sp. TaxID=3060586 RepID=UPI002ED433F6